MNEVNGLPTHILLVHAVVVLLPLAALLAAVTAWWPGLRRRLGVLTPILAVGAAALVPITTNAGEWLQAHVAGSDLIARHAEFGDQVLPWALALAALSVAGWWWGRVLDTPDRAGGRRDRWITIVAGLLTVAVAVGTVVAVIQAGDSGAQASWQGRFTSDSGVAG